VAVGGNVPMADSTASLLAIQVVGWTCSTCYSRSPELRQADHWPRPAMGGCEPRRLCVGLLASAFSAWAGPGMSTRRSVTGCGGRPCPTRHARLPLYQNTQPTCPGFLLRRCRLARHGAGRFFFVRVSRVMC